MGDTNRVGWFNALGDAVPEEQRQAAIDTLQEMGLEVSDGVPWVDEVAKHIERDNPEKALEIPRRHLDLTGMYRFLAVLCTPVECYNETEPNGDSQ